MLQLKLTRKYPKNTYTIGNFYCNGVFFSNSLEDKDRGLISSMSLDEINKIKIYGETAIPKGTYDVRLTYSPKFVNKPWAKKYNGLVPQIMGVKGYSGVRIHPFNDPKESLGCIAVGKNNIKGKVSNATDFYLKLMADYIWPSWKKGESIKITIE